MPTQTKPPCILGVSKMWCGWLVGCVFAQKNRANGVDLHNKTAISECWSHIRCSRTHLNLGLSFRPRDHGISKNPRLLASQMSEGVKGESGDWQKQGGKKKRWATSLAREWQKMGQHEGGSTISITVRAIIRKTLAVELEEGKPHILIAIWHHLLLVVHSLNRGGTS